jgi:hypothetical protein
MDAIVSLLALAKDDLDRNDMGTVVSEDVHLVRRAGRLDGSPVQGRAEKEIYNEGASYLQCR